MSEFSVNGSCSCLALYSSQNQKLDYESLYNKLLLLSTKYGCLITHGGITGKGYRENIKPIKFIDKQLKMKSFYGLDSLNVMSVLSEGNYYNWQFYASVTSFPTMQGCELIICLDENFTLFNTDLDDLIIDLNKLFRIDYGIAYSRLYSQGPHYYASGMVQGIEKKSIEADRIAIWFRAILNNNFFSHNVLRDIYPVNVLNKNQVHAKLKSKTLVSFASDLTLKSWIEKKGLGHITQLTDELWLWKIDSDLDYIREKLCKAKLLIYCIHN